MRQYVDVQSLRFFDLVSAAAAAPFGVRYIIKSFNGIDQCKPAIHDETLDENLLVLLVVAMERMVFPN